jgi:hypothetical protein
VGLDATKIVRAQNRRLRKPLEILGYDITLSKLVGPGEQPQVKQQFAPRLIQTLGDLAKLDMDVARGSFVPLPTLATQMITVMLTELDLLEPVKGQG